MLNSRIYKKETCGTPLVTSFVVEDDPLTLKAWLSNQFFSPLVIHSSTLERSNVGYKIILSGSLKSLTKGTCKASHFITGDNQVDQAWPTTLKSMLIPITSITLYAKKYFLRVLFSKFSQGSKWDWIVLFSLFWSCVYSICFSPVTRERLLPVSLTFQRSYRGDLASQGL